MEPNLKNDFTSICELCGDTKKLNDLTQSDLTYVLCKFQWITRRKDIADVIKMKTVCENCLQKMHLLIDNVAQIWKMYICTQDMLKLYSESSFTTDWAHFQKLGAKNKNKFNKSEKLSPIVKKDLEIEGTKQNYDGIVNPVLKREIEASTSVEGCTNLEWLLETDSSDEKTNGCNDTNIKKNIEQEVSITRTNNRGITYTSNSPNFIIKQPNGVFECTLCRANFSYRFKAEHHVRSQHTKETPFACAMCPKSFMAVYNLNRHIACVHEKGKFICEKCGQRFQKQYILKAHEQSHYGPPTLACPFNKCTKKFYADFVLKMHVTNSHKGLTFVCEQCGKAFRTKVRLTNHLQRHGDKTIKCPLCPKMFYITTDRLLHMKYHKEDMPWRCWKCNMYFKTTRGLQNHLSVTHGEKVSKVDLYKQNTVK